MIFFEALAELLLQTFVDFGCKGNANPTELIELLKFWGSLINSNSFAIEVAKVCNIHKCRILYEKPSFLNPIQYCDKNSFNEIIPTWILFEYKIPILSVHRKCKAPDLLSLLVWLT